MIATNPRRLNGAGGSLYSVSLLFQLVICSRASRSLSNPNMAAYATNRPRATAPATMY